MPNYVNKALATLHHSPPIKDQHSPHPYNTLIHGQKHQFVIPPIINEKLTPTQLKHCQECCGFLVIMLDPLKTPCKQTSASSPPLFQ